MNASASTRAARPLTLFAALATVALLPVAPAGAAPQVAPGQPSARVRIADLDLKTEQGTRILLQRLEHAAHSVCQPENFRDFAALSAAASCRHQAVDNALAQLHGVDAPRLAQHVDLARR